MIYLKIDFLFIIINYNKNIMEALNFIKQYHKLYIGNIDNIDYSILDKNNNSYFYYETLIKNNIYNYNNNENIIYGNFKNNFLIISIDDNNNIKLKLFLNNKYNIFFEIQNNKIYFMNIHQMEELIIINIINNELNITLTQSILDNIFIQSNNNIKNINIKYYDGLIKDNINLFLDYLRYKK